jgi:hypothetical protein
MKINFLAEFFTYARPMRFPHVHDQSLGARNTLNFRPPFRLQNGL